MLKHALLSLCVLLYAHSGPLFATSSPLDFVQLHSQLDSTLQELQVPGAQVAVFNSKQLLWQASFGYTDPEQQIPVNDNTLFRAGSTTKTLVALAIMQLVQQDKFSLQDEVLQLEPALLLQNPWQSSHPVRVIHLLEHTAGLDDMHFRNIYNRHDPGIPLLDAVNRDAASLKVRWQPGTRHAYSNPGYGILGHLIEKYSTQRFEDYIEQQVLQPLGMSSCQLSTSLKPDPRLSHGFSHAKTVPFQQIYLRSAGNLECNAAGMAQLGLWLLSQAQTAQLPHLDTNSIHPLERPESTLAAQQGLTYGYAKAIYASTRSGREWLGHDGGIDGFLTSYGYNRELDLGYAVMLNSSNVRLRRLTDIITQSFQTDATIAAPTLVAIDRPEIDGYYRASNIRNQLFAGIAFSTAVGKVTTEGSDLLAAPILGAANHYQHLGHGQFAKAGESHATLKVIGHTPEGFAIEIHGDYLLKVSALSAWLPMLLLGFCCSIFVLTLGYAPIWLINAIRGKFSSPAQLWLRALPFVNVTLLAAVLVALFNLSLPEAAKVNWQTLTIYWGTLAFALHGAIATAAVLYWYRLEPSRPARYFAVLSVLAANAFAVYCFRFDYLGLALWQW